MPAHRVFLLLFVGQVSIITDKGVGEGGLLEKLSPRELLTKRACSYRVHNTTSPRKNLRLILATYHLLFPRCHSVKKERSTVFAIF